MALIYFADLCPVAFSFLPERFGFEGPAVEYHGGEVLVRYEKGPYLIKVVMVSGTAPHVELFYPAAETGEPEIPWASLPGLPRARGFVMRHRSVSPPWPEQQKAYLEDLADHLLRMEGERLERWGQWEGA